MLDPDELDKFIDEISFDTPPNFVEVQKLRSSNEKLKIQIRELIRSAKEVLKNYKSEVEKSTKLEKDLQDIKQQQNHRNLEYYALEKQHQEDEKQSINRIFSLNQEIDQLKEKSAEEQKDRIQITVDYFNMMSDVTCYYNYEIKKHQNPVLAKAEKFLCGIYGDKYKKPKICRSKRGGQDDDTYSVTSTNSNKRRANSKVTKSKKLKAEDLEFNSISQVSSPLSLDFDENSSISTWTDSGISMNTTFCPSPKLPSMHCTCNVDNLPKLVSIGVNTDEPFEELPSLPLLCCDESENELGRMGEEIENLLDVSQEIPSAVDGNEITKVEELFEPEDNNQQSEICYENLMNLEEVVEPIRVLEEVILVDQGTSTEFCETADKSVNTIRSTTTRGTSTPKLVTKNFSMQFPEVSMTRIFEETLFELPDVLSPIEEEDIEDEEKSMTTCIGTVTELCNVNREIDYLINQPLKIKIEKSTFNDRIDMDEQSFLVLGQTVFNLLLKRIQQNKSSSKLNDDEIDREEIWRRINRQLLEKQSEIDISFTESEKSCDKSFCDDVDLNLSFSESEKSVEDESEKTQINHDEVEMPNVAVEVTLEESESDKVQESIDCANFEEIMKDLQSLLPASAEFDLIEPIEDICDTIWKTIFPEDLESHENLDFDSPTSPSNILEEFDFECESLEIPIDLEIEELNLPKVLKYSENDTPKSPPPFVNQQTFEAIEIPAESTLSSISRENEFNSIFKYDSNKRQKLLNWQTVHNSLSKSSKVAVSEIELSIKNYIGNEWTTDNLNICIEVIVKHSEGLVAKAIFNVVQHFKTDREICMEFTPPAPALPRYLQKLILLINNVTENFSTLPQRLIEDLEENIFKCQKSKDTKFDQEDLRNFAYYYSSLVDLFYEGNTSMAFYFIVKSIYFYEQNAIPMVFVLIKAFPMCMVKKSRLLRKASPHIDWESMSGLEISKVQLNHDEIDSLDLTIMFILTYPQIYAKFKSLQSHEHFNFAPKFYGFYQGFMCPAKLLSKLMERLESGHVENISLSFIIFAKIMPPKFTIETMVKGKLMPFLLQLSQQDHLEQKQVNQICILIEILSSILKAFASEREQTIRVIFTKIIEIYGRYPNMKVRESCLKALLRLQKFSENHKEIFSMLKQHVESNKNCMSENLYAAIETFIYRKRETCFQELNS